MKKILEKLNYDIKLNDKDRSKVVTQNARLKPRCKIIIF